MVFRIHHSAKKDLYVFLLAILIFSIAMFLAGGFCLGIGMILIVFFNNMPITYDIWISPITLPISLMFGVPNIPVNGIMILFASEILGIILYFIPVAYIGSRATLGIYFRIVTGKVGTILTKAHILTLTKDYYSEMQFIHEVDLRGTKKIFNEVINRRWSLIITFPVMVIFLISVFTFKLNSGNFFYIIFMVFPIYIYLIILLSSLYVPTVLVLDEAGIKQISIGETGDVEVILRLGATFRNGINNCILVIVTLIGIGDIIFALTKQQLALNQNVYYFNDLVYFGVLIVAAGFYLLFASFFVPAMSLMALSFLKGKGYTKTIYLAREKYVKKFNMNVGTVTNVFSQSSDKKTVIAHVNFKGDNIQEQIK